MAGSRVQVGSTDSGANGSGQKREVNRENKEEEIQEEPSEDDHNNNNDNDINESKDLGIEASFGENVLDIEACLVINFAHSFNLVDISRILANACVLYHVCLLGGRSTRESTPCSLIRDPETIITPGSTTRPASSTETSRRIQNSVHRHIPTAHEMDEFFAGAEEEQQRQFIEKYNFDPVKDKPLPGRYEWEKLDPRRH
ncbi:hypothetical protein GH714_022513 [Hevea brasiliensis]|uniref:Cyclin-dependent kinase inhibitor domain-containing protein n=1 Tax=Hevea brasiliensis TaxID=3981 RepID=A0A6A6KLH8_HEVBR|nr:hypothetical protein GH714_022513 [Hevea brasiliensis]